MSLNTASLSSSLMAFLRPLSKGNVTTLQALSYTSTVLIGWGLYKLLARYISWLTSPLWRQLPGPKCRSFLWGVYPEILRDPFMTPHKKWAVAAGWDNVDNDEKDPPPKFVHYTTMFGRSCVLVLDRDVIKTILTAPAGKAHVRFRKEMAFLQTVIGNGLVILEGEDWMRHRRIIQPAFSTPLLRQGLQQVVPDRTNELIRYWKMATATTTTTTSSSSSTTTTIREIDVQSHFSALTLDIIGPMAFSHNFHGLDSIREWAEAAAANPDNTNNNITDKGDDATLAEAKDPFVHALSNAFQFDRLSTLCYVLNLPSVDKWRARKRVARRFLNQETDKIVAQASAKQDVDTGSTTTSTTVPSQEEKEKESSTSPKIKSLLSTLLDAQKAQGENAGGLSAEELRDEVKTFMLAGHETTSTWCYWAIYALAKNPKIQEQVYQNVLKHAPWTYAEHIGVEHVEKMEYLGAFLQEVLRMYPPAGFFARVNVGPETLGGVTFPPNTRFCLSSQIMHRHPKHWDDPETFQPERWINVSDSENERRRFAFFPFSLGGRNCIGQYFATIEAEMIVAAIVRSFRIEIAPSQTDIEHTFTAAVTMKSKPRLKIAVFPRIVGTLVEI